MTAPRVLFVTGKLAEPALRRVVSRIPGVEPVVTVLPISVAALLTTEWVARHLDVPPDIQRIILPGLCQGQLSVVGGHVERGPEDLRDLPEYLGGQAAAAPTLDHFNFEIIAEINHAPRLSRDELLAAARRYREQGADVIDLGCDPGSTWVGVGDAVRALREAGLRVSVDSFNPAEVAMAARAGAELVLSVNSSNVAAAADWGVEVVAIPDTPCDLVSLDATVDQLTARDIRFRIDPILEPINFGFSAALGRYVDVRRRYPDVAMMMGVGNVTELTEVDSAGVNMLLAGICQELGIGSVLTTSVANWCRNCVRELDLSRRIVAAAARQHQPPKKLSTDLVQLSDPKLRETDLDELAAGITDRNYRLFAERGQLHVINAAMHLTGDDPFALFGEVMRRDARIDPSHAFYLGYEFAKAVTALTLGKNYVQDQALRWGFQTRPEDCHR